jgi:FkbM family methyltransferase
MSEKLKQETRIEELQSSQNQQSPATGDGPDHAAFDRNRSRLISWLTRRLVRWRGGYRASRLLIDFLGGVTPLEAEVMGYRMLLDPKDHVCSNLLYYPQLFEPEECAALLPQIRPEDVVVDVGAHVGFYSLLASKRAARVLSIEADPKTFRYLERNLAMNRATKIRALQAGVSDRCETLKLFSDDALGDLSAHSFMPGWGRSDAVEVECFPLIQLMKAQGFDSCDVLKIDVEGFEYRVLKPLFDQTEIRPRLVLVEYYEKRNSGDVRALLDSQGYHLYRQIGRDYLFGLDQSQAPNNMSIRREPE